MYLWLAKMPASSYAISDSNIPLWFYRRQLGLGSEPGLVLIGRRVQPPKSLGKHGTIHRLSWQNASMCSWHIPQQTAVGEVNIKYHRGSISTKPTTPRYIVAVMDSAGSGSSACTLRL
jgi:hypothetical protein